jgi:hypothetical protein
LLRELKMKRKLLILAVLALALPVWADVNNIPKASDGKDATGTKTVRVFRGLNFTAATSEALVTLTPSADWVDAATGTSFTVTSGKRLVLVALYSSSKAAGAAVQAVTVKLRASASGAVTTSSPVVAMCSAGVVSATANITNGSVAQISQSWPTVIELSGAMQFGISQVGTATAGNDVSLLTYEY